MRETGNVYSIMSGRALAFTLAGILALAVFFCGVSAQAQTPADDQYGSPMAVGVAEGPGIGAVEDPKTGPNADAVVSSTGSGGGVASNDAGDNQGPLASVLPSTGGSLGSLVGLVALALIGTGALVFRSRSARS